MTEAEITETATQIAESLRGQCVETIDSQLEARGLDIASAPMALLQAIDDQVFLCETCGWYCGADEMSDTDMVCDDCEE